jgi:hypothetical protein
MWCLGRLSVRVSKEKQKETGENKEQKPGGRAERKADEEADEEGPAYERPARRVNSHREQNQMPLSLE